MRNLRVSVLVQTLSWVSLFAMIWLQIFNLLPTRSFWIGVSAFFLLGMVAMLLGSYEPRKRPSPPLPPFEE